MAELTLCLKHFSSIFFPSNRRRVDANESLEQVRKFHMKIQCLFKRLYSKSDATSQSPGILLSNSCYRFPRCVRRNVSLPYRVRRTVSLVRRPHVFPMPQPRPAHRPLEGSLGPHGRAVMAGLRSPFQSRASTGYCITLAALQALRTATKPGTHPCPHSRRPTYACQSGMWEQGHGEMARQNRQ